MGCSGSKDTGASSASGIRRFLSGFFFCAPFFFFSFSFFFCAAFFLFSSRKAATS